MKQVNKRLDDLEHSTKPVKGLVVLWSDFDLEGVYWDGPFYNHDRRKYSEDDLREFRPGYDDVFIVRYEKNWRSEGGT